MEVGVLGHSFVCDHRLNPELFGEERDRIRFCGISGGKTTTMINHGTVQNFLQHPMERVFLQIGGNDISEMSNPYQIVSSIDTLVNRARQVPGVEHLIVGSLFQRFKTRGTDPATYENQRLIINQELQRLYRDDDTVKFWRLKKLQFVSEGHFIDGVHLKPQQVPKFVQNIKSALFSWNR